MSSKISSRLSRVSTASQKAKNENVYNDKEASAKPLSTRNRLALKDVTNNTPAKKATEKYASPHKTPCSDTPSQKRGVCEKIEVTRKKSGGVVSEVLADLMILSFHNYSDLRKY